MCRTVVFPAVLKLGVLITFSEEDSGTAIELKLKHIPLYCSVMFTSFPSLNNEGFAAMLFALKEICVAAKSSAFTVG